MFRQAVGPSLEGLRAQNEVRTTLLQGLGGAILLVGAYVTYRQLQTSREGQITERFTRAIDQLGSEHLDVRLGGIYALERIARDSPADRATIGEVLTAFVRTHAPWPPSLPNQPAATAPIDQVPKLQVRAPDVQASLWVLGRGGFARALGQDQWLDLSAVDLRRADLRDAHLGDVDFRFAGLQKAYLGGAHLQGAFLDGSHLEWAYLGGAHLDSANLDGTHLEGAVADERTRWPDGFDWRRSRRQWAAVPASRALNPWRRPHAHAWAAGGPARQRRACGCSAVWRWGEYQA